MCLHFYIVSLNLFLSPSLISALTPLSTEAFHRIGSSQTGGWTIFLSDMCLTTGRIVVAPADQAFEYGYGRVAAVALACITIVGCVASGSQLIGAATRHDTIGKQLGIATVHVLGIHGRRTFSCLALLLLQLALVAVIALVAAAQHT